MGKPAKDALNATGNAIELSRPAAAANQEGPNALTSRCQKVPPAITVVWRASSAMSGYQNAAIVPGKAKGVSTAAS